VYISNLFEECENENENEKRGLCVKVIPTGYAVLISQANSSRFYIITNVFLLILLTQLLIKAAI
jgi:hypothetical protein